MSLFSILPWWTWLVGSVGFFGALAFLLLLPALAGVVGREVAAAIVRALKTPIGAAIIVGSIAFFAGHIHGGIYVERKCVALRADDRAKAEKARAERDAQISADLERRLKPRVAELEQQAGTLQKQVESYERKLLAEKGGNHCPLGDEPLRLRKQRR